MMIPKMSEKIFWRYFALFSPQDVSRDLWRGRRQAVDHLGADLIQDLVLETVLLRTSNCISSGFCLYFFAFLWVCTAVYIVACFRLFYSSLTRWGFHTPVRHMEKMMKMMTILHILDIRKVVLLKGKKNVLISKVCQPFSESRARDHREEPGRYTDIWYAQIWAYINKAIQL